MKKIIYLLLLLTTVQVNATLIERDYRNNGDGLITYDTETGFEWLDLTETLGVSYNIVSSKLGAGNDLEGWQYGTAAQVASFFDSAGGSGVYESHSSSHNDVTEIIIPLWGETYGDSGYRQSNFLTGTSHVSGMHLSGGVTDYYGNYEYPNSTQDIIRFAYVDFAQPDYAGNRLTGSALMRISSVPEPSTISLFALGLLGLAYSRKKA